MAQIDPFEQIRQIAELDPTPVDETYRVKIQERTQADNLNWLSGMSGPAAMSTAGIKDQSGGNIAPPPESPVEVGPKRTAGEIAASVASDVGGGIVESGTQVIGGAADAINAMVSGLSRNMAPIITTLFPEAARIAEGKGIDVTSGAVADLAERSAPGLATTGEAKTITGGFIRGISQFVTGFAVGGKGIGGGKVAKNVASGVFSDFAAFDGHEARLSNLIQEYPKLANPVTEFLAADAEDSEVVGRLKNVVEGLGGNAIFSGLLVALRSLKDARRIKAQTGSETFADAAQRAATEAIGGENAMLRPAADMARITGPVDQPTFQIKNVQTGVPDDVLAKAASTEGLSRVPLGKDREVFINFSRINSTDDIKRLVADMADAFAGDIGEAQRGVRTNKTTVKAAGDENAWKLLAERRNGEALNAEQTFAVRTLWASSSENLARMAKEASTNPSPENLFAFRRAFSMHSAIQKEALAVRTETARALQQWAIPSGGSTEAFKAISEVINMHGGSEVSEELARRVAFLAENGNQGAVDYLARKGALASSLDAVQEYWINAILSGPKTHLVNVLSNTSVAGLSVVERAVAERIGDVLQGGTRTQMGEAGAMVHGFVSSAREALQNAWKSLKTGETGFGIQKLEGPRIRAISTESLGNTRNETFNKVINTSPIARGIDAIGSVVTLPGRFLGAEDEFFKTLNYRMEVHANAFRQASSEVESGAIPRAQFKERLADLTDNPPESIRLDAQEFAAYNTFTKDPGKFVKSVQGAIGKYPIARFIIPFINTPANIVKFTFERTPFAPISGKVRADLAAGGARRDMALARVGIGSAAMLTAYDMALNGKVTGSGPSNWNERSSQRREGWQPYSLKIGNRYYAYNRLDPIGFLLGLGGDLGEYSLNTSDDPNAEFEEMATMAIFSAAENLTSKTYMAGFSNAIEALSDPGRFSVNYAERFVGSFVPAIVAETARISDPQMKHATSFMQKLKSRIPGLSQDVPNRHDLWGRTMSFQSGLGQAYDTISPIYSSEYKPEPADRELDRLGVFKGMPGKGIGISLNGKTERVSLRNSPEIYERYVVLSGGTGANEIGRPMTSAGNMSAVGKRLESYGDYSALGLINAIVSGEHPDSKAYDEMTDDQKADFLSGIFNDYRAGARETIRDEYPELMQFRENMK